MIRFRVFGSVELTGPGGEEVTSVLAQPKRTALLAFLVLATPRGFHRRDKIVGLFWPDSDHDRARASLRRSLHFLRRSLGEDVIVGRGDGELSLNSDLVWSDVEAFERAMESGDLEGGLELYRGDPLEGYFLSGCPDFERWLDGERGRLRGVAARAAWTLAHQFISDGQLTDAERTGQRAMSLVPTDENEVRVFMEALARAGDRAAAMRLYEKFAAVLSEDLDLEPSPETRVVVEAIRENNEGNQTRVQSVVSGNLGMEEEPPPLPVLPKTAHRGSMRKHPPQWALATLTGAFLVFLALGKLFEASERPHPDADDRPGIAVLPCENWSPDLEDAYFATGIHGEILRTLSRISGLRSIGWESVGWYRDNPRSVQQVAEELDVGFLAKCSVGKGQDRNQINLTFELLDGTTGIQLWENSYEEDLSARGIRDIREALATRVAQEVGAEISRTDRLRIGALPTRNDAAYDHYLQGVFERNKGTTESMFMGIRHLRLAVGLDPGFAQAYSSLAGALAWVSLYSPSVDHDAMVAAGETAVRQALVADPNLASGHAMDGLFRFLVGHDMEGAGVAFRRAIEIDPFCYEGLLNLGMVLSHAGRDEEAIEAVKRGLAVDPLAVGANWNLAFRYYWAGQHEAAIRQIDHTLDLVGENPLVWLTSAFILSRAGDHGRAERALEGWGSRAGVHPDTAARLAAITTAFQRTGHPNPGVANRQLLDGLPLYWSYRLAAFLGDLPAALKILEDAEQDIWVHLISLQADPLGAPLRDHPRFQAMLDRYEDDGQQ